MTFLSSEITTSGDTGSDARPSRRSAIFAASFSAFRLNCSSALPPPLHPVAASSAAVIVVMSRLFMARRVPAGYRDVASG